ncbi:MAG: DUF4476 domain-containing protein [Flavobacteriales bacterium]|nr:DUF4476 domain-containing protein [Flavobacteriales bacterium]
MKTKIFTLVAGFTILAESAMAHAGKSELNIRLWDNGMFTLVVNNQSFSTPTTNFSMANLRPGNHQLKVFRNFINPYGYGGNVKMVYNGWVSIQPNTKLLAFVNSNGQLVVESLMPCHHKYYGNGYGNNWQYNNYNGNQYNGYGNTYGNYQYNNNGGSNYYNGGGYGYSYGMLPEQFSQLKLTIGNTSFDNTRLTVMKQAVAANQVTTAQVNELLGMLSFESTRLDFAKYAYAYTLDKENYYMVNNTFSFSSSIAELNHFIGQFNG